MGKLAPHVDGYYTIREGAQHLQCSKRNVYQYIKTLQIIPAKFGDYIVFDYLAESDVERIAQARATGRGPSSRIQPLGRTKKELEADVSALHAALDALLALFVSQHGYDYSVVDEALQALARNAGRLSGTAVFEERIAQIRKEPS